MKKKSKIKKIFVIGSDFSETTGEGVLGNNFIDTYAKLKKNIKFKKKKVFKNSYNKKNLIHKYFIPILNSIYVRLNKKKKFIYLNYLPLWNFLIFLILPKKTILGPITGSYIINDKSYFSNKIRKYMFPFLYKVSLKIITKKFERAVFSTNLLKNIFNKIEINFLSSFVVNYFNFKKIKNKKNYGKKYDIIFYYREHNNKNDTQFNKFVRAISKTKKICIVGDKLNIKSNNVINKGYIGKIKIQKLMMRSKFAICAPENLYSLFAIDSYNNGCCLLINEKLKKYQICNSLNFYFVNFLYTKKNIDIVSKIIEKKTFKEDKKFQKFINQKKLEINRFLSTI